MQVQHIFDVAVGTNGGGGVGPIFDCTSYTFKERNKELTTVKSFFLIAIFVSAVKN